MTTLRMPDLGTVEGSVTLVRWLKREGDAVALAEPLFEVETDKGVSEVECAAEGTLAARLVAEGATVAAGDPIASIRGQGEPAEAAPAAAPRGPAPVIVALAAKHGVDLASIEGTGPGGVVTRQDVLRARDAGRGLAHGASSAAPRPSSPLSSAALAGGQSIVAARMSQSHREKPVFHVTTRVDMTRVIAERGKLPFDAFFAKACGAAVAEFPVFRQYLLGTESGRHDAVDIAVAISIGDDLFAPAVRSADRRSIAEISADIEGLAAKAKARTLTAADAQGSCFLVSNLGMFGVESFDAVILPEHSSALAIGAARPTPVADGQGVRIVPLAAMTLSVDHRVINGAAAARFLGRVKEHLEKGGWA
jgi:pyruvate dehydrogenase E2 component (dihydrolipoamide acetyltransferase)